MGIGRIFSREGLRMNFPEVAKKIFAGGAKSGKISFQPLKIKKTNFLLKI